MISSAMVLAAGLGTRMRPITETIPKPLVSVGGMTMLDRVLGHLSAGGVSQVVVNLHYLPDCITDHLAQGGVPAGLSLAYSDEREQLLETGGGVKKALPLLGAAPFWVANADIVWTDGPQASAVERMAAAWDPERMDALLLLHPQATAWGYEGGGDFFCAADGRILGRCADKALAAQPGAIPYVYAGLQILKPALFEDTPDGPWSLNVVFNRALAAGRLYGVPHDGRWFHVGTPADIAPTTAEILRLQQ